MTNHVRRTTHILDVISSVSRSSKCTKNAGGWGGEETRPCREAVIYLDEDCGSEHIMERHGLDAVTAGDPDRVEQTAALRCKCLVGHRT